MDINIIRESTSPYWKFLNTQFISSLIGALAGAFAGAFAAHKIAENAKEREYLRTQIRAINAAIMTSSVVCTGMLASKDQQIKDIYLSYKKNKEQYLHAISNYKPGMTIECHFDMRGIQKPHVPIESLVKLIYEKIDVIGRPLALVAAIENALNNLNEMIVARESIIDKFRKNQGYINDQEKAKFYFGLNLSDGSLSTEYSDSLRGIYDYTDDVIFYSSLLCADLEKLGNKLLTTYKDNHGDNIEEISSVTFENSNMPDPRRYTSWLSGFQKRTSIIHKLSYRNILRILFSSGSG